MGVKMVGRMGHAWLWCRTPEGARFIGILLVALLVRLVLAPYHGFFYDLQAYADWGVLLSQHFLDFYTRGARANFIVNYPPLANYLFCAQVVAFGGIAHALGARPTFVIEHEPFLALYMKLPDLIADLGIVTLIYSAARRLATERTALLVAAGYALSPAILFDGALWGQTDALSLLFTLLALRGATRHEAGRAGALCAAAVLLKPQAIIFVPLVPVYLYRWSGWSSASRAVYSLVGTVAIVCIPYVLPPRPELLAFYGNVQLAIRSMPYASVDAYNMWWLFTGAFHPYTAPAIGLLSCAMVGWLLFGAVALVALLGVWKKRSPDQIYAAAGLLALGFFDVTVLQHERYLYPAIALFLLAALHDRRYWTIAYITSATVFLNMGIVVVYYSAVSQIGIDGSAWQPLHLPIWTLVIAAANVWLLLYCLTLYVRERPSAPRQCDHVTRVTDQIELQNSVA